mmetsp:Transcript_13742/g.28783  ORF Transcript_13742/g.28783 Transcript_13742/m.28783 type:complete len:782 (-) Transcript_13742:376-2721(-)|eukprot:CAMPEP_0168196446 /NCGR_PEP_ID=MMETSP0139_2-20121125/20515_1 /TAXON_ID=44445 /ORGANISM="Pseudo-nitzschia australis, Strain 10249 10 AB" /LENGTH=781 /DNA_ID=CAMNT_0008120611 /DNA_START=46 /DNA_END=2391 /DNA_ORIENTATION=+
MATKKKNLFVDDDSSSSSDDSSTSSSSSASPTKRSSKKDSNSLKVSVKAKEDDELRLTVNKRFATKYQNKKEQEELQHIRQRKQREGIVDGDGSSESDSSDEEEDEDGELFTPSVNVQFLKTIKALRKKDDKIYDPKAQFFDDLIENDGGDDDAKSKASGRKPQRYKDVVRAQILEQMEEEDIGDTESTTKKGRVDVDDSTDSRSRSKLGYDAEQEKLRKAFLTESSNADGGDNDDWMVVKKAAETPDLDKLKQEASEELKEIETISKKNNKSGDGDDVFKDPRGEVGDGEKFLLDFITNKKWIDRNDIHRNGDDDDDELSLDDVERADEYESNYNFRFEQAAQETATSGASLSVQTYARSQTMNTVRRQDTTRKDKREARKERKTAERKAKEEQLKRLKNAKKKEMNQKLSQVKAVIGDADENVLDEAAIMKMLEGDYDPEKFEKAMENAYGEDFYQQEDTEWKNDLDVRQTLKGDDEGDQLVGQDDLNGGMYDNVQEGEVNEDAMDDADYDENAEWDDDEYDNTNEESKLEKKLKTKMQEELYKLDYEDIVAGMPTRFKYREVESNDYGLTTQEILFARDNSLKQFVSLKKMAPYNEQGEHQVGSKKRRKFREMLKKDLEDNLPKEEELQEDKAVDTESAPAEPEPKKKRRRLKKGKKSKDDGASSANNDTKMEDVKTNLENSGSTKKRRKKSGKKGEILGKEATSNDTINEQTKSGENHDKTTENTSSPSDAGFTKRSSNSNTASSAGDKQKKKKRKSKDKKSSIAGISQSRLASYGL